MNRWAASIVQAARVGTRPVRRVGRRWLNHINGLRKAVSVPVANLLLGGERFIEAGIYARMIGDSLRPSRRVADGPHAALLRAYDRIGDRILQSPEFEQTDYYRNAAQCIDMTGAYCFDSQAPRDIARIARGFIDDYKGVAEWRKRPRRPLSLPPDPLLVRPIKDSACYEVIDGHHRVAIAAVKGQKTIRVVPIWQPAHTPLQELLLGVFWNKGRRELYQPIDSPELGDKWILVRRCADRLEIMRRFLAESAITPGAARSYLDLGASYGWFVSQMAAAGYDSLGVERDPFSCGVGELMYGLAPDRMVRADCVRFLGENTRRFDIVSCFSVLHHFVNGKGPIAAEEFIRMIDGVTGSVLFLDTGQEHETWFKPDLKGWSPDFIESWLKHHTTFSRIVRLGVDQDARAPFQDNYGRTLFACVR